MSIKLILVITLLCVYEVASQNSTTIGDYGQSGNSQVAVDTVLANPAMSTANAKCKESDSTNVCITKPTCCHITNSYSAYKYSACVDIVSASLAPTFCESFYALNAKEGFYSSECVCKDYFHLSSSYVTVGYSVLILILLSILL